MPEDATTDDLRWDSELARIEGYRDIGCEAQPLCVWGTGRG